MRFSRAIAASLSVVLISSVPAIGAVRAGATCKKAGQTKIAQNKTFTCIKSGKILVWNKGKAIKTAAPILKPTPTPTPTPSPKPTPSPTPEPPPSPIATPAPNPTLESLFLPWSTGFKAEEMYRLAVKKTHEFFDSSKQPSENLTLIVQETFEAADAEMLKSIGIGSNSIFYPITKQPTILIYATSPKWAGEQASRFNLRVGSYDLPCGGNGSWDSYCAADNAGYMIYNGRYNEAQKNNQKRLDFGVGAKSVVAHEYFHTVQYALSKGEVRDPSSPLFIPTWLYEGSANFVGFAVIDYLGIEKYEEGRFSEVETHNDYKKKESNVSLREFQNYGSNNNGVSLNPYGIGMAATEYIVASAGFQSLLNIFSFSKTAQSFPAAFERAVGISLENFYKNFDQARANFLLGSK